MVVVVKWGVLCWWSEGVGAREMSVAECGGRCPARCGRGAGAGEPAGAVGQIRSEMVCTRVNAMARSVVQGQVVESRQMVRRPVVMMWPAVWSKQ